MLLIADSGATKADWCFVDDKQQQHRFATIGFSPYFQNTPTITAEIEQTLMPHLKHLLPQQGNPLHLFFYGTGCSSDERCEVVAAALRMNFPDASIEVNHDLLGAARALCGNSEGIAAIMGTGSNSCYYDGKDITENISSLGYVLGDEGSGAHLGKTLLQRYLNKELPTAVASLLDQHYHLTKDDILNTLYRQPMPNRFLASFSPFIFQHIADKYLHDMVAQCFHAFFDQHICKYPRCHDTTLHCVGSVAYYYAAVLKEVALARAVKLGQLLKAPMENLVAFHLTETIKSKG